MYKQTTIMVGSFPLRSNQFWIADCQQLSKFERASRAAKSLKMQRQFLKTARMYIDKKDIKSAQVWLDNWKLERSYHAHMLGAFDHIEL